MSQTTLLSTRSPHENSGPSLPERLKIGLLSDTFLPVSNGVTHTVASLARIFAAEGHEPHIFTFAPTGELRVVPEGLLDDPPHLLRVPPREGEEAIFGVPIHYAPALPILDSGYYFGVRYPMWMRSLLNEMDVLHVHHPFVSGRLARLLRRDEQPLIFTNHTRYDIYSHYLQNAMPRGVQPLTNPLISPEVLGRRFAMRAARFANFCDAVIAPSASMESVLASWGVRAPVFTVPNGVDLTRFDDNEIETDKTETDKTIEELDKSSTQSSLSSHETASKLNLTAKKRLESRLRWRAAWNVSPDAPLSIYLGRLAPEKNGASLLQAFALVQRKINAARLVIIGDGPSDEEWKEQVRSLELENFVHFAGALSSSQVPDALRAADLFASTSVSEVHPLTLIEAMASGLPCLGTPTPGVQDTICDGRNGWLAEPEPRCFAAVWSAALRDDEERKRRGTLAKIDSQAYSIEANAARVMELYQRILRERLARHN